MGIFAAILLSGTARALPDLSVQNADVQLPAGAEVGIPFTLQVTIHNTSGTYHDQVVAAPVIEHATPTDPLNVTSRNVALNTWNAQTIVADRDFLLSRIDLRVFDKGDGSDDIRLRVRRNGSGFSPSNSAGDILASVLVNSTLTDTAAPVFEQFTFSSPVFLTQGTTVWFTVESDISSLNSYGILLDSGVAVNEMAFSGDQGTNWSPDARAFLAFQQLYEPKTTLVRFYRGDPDSGGTLLGISTISVPIGAGGNTQVSLTTTVAAAGSYDIYAQVDGTDDIIEVSNANNKAFQSLTVVLPAPQVAQASAPDGTTGIDPASALTFTFNRSMSSSTLPGAFSFKAVRNSAGETLNQSLAGSLTYDDPSKTATFTPSAVMDSGFQYEAAFSDLALDATGFALTPFTATFTTAQNDGQENTLLASDGQTKVVLPAGAVGSSAYYVTVDVAPAASPAVETANTKALRGTDSFRYPLSGTLRKLSLYEGSYPGTLVAHPSFARSVTLTLPYTDNGQGFVTGTNPPVLEKNLSIYWLNENDGLWVRLPDAVVDTANNTVTAAVPHFSYFVLMGMNAPDLSQAYAYPVPFRPSQGHTRVKFSGLSPACTIRIYSVDGELVKSIEETDGDGFNDSWDGNTASGAYLYIIDNGSQKKTGQLVIIK